MRIVATGATRNVGSAVVEALSPDDAVAEIVGLARRETTWSPAKTRFVTADVSTDGLEQHFEGADAVIHLAWLFQPTLRPLVAWRANALGSMRVFDAAAAAGVRAIVHASSVAAYSPGDGDRRVDETWPTHALPTAAYTARSPTWSGPSMASSWPTPTCACCACAAASRHRDASAQERPGRYPRHRCRPASDCLGRG